MKRALALIITTLLLAGCGGGGNSSSSVAPATQAKAQNGTGSVTLTIPAGGTSQTSGKVRYPQFVSPSATSVELSVNGGADQNFNVASNSPLCTTTTSGRTCTLTFGAPAGSDTFAFEIFEGANGTGTLLAQTTTTQAISATGTFNFSIGLNAVVGTIVVNIQTNNGTQGNCPDGSSNFNGITEGCAGSVPGTVTVYDPSGAQVTGTAAYAGALVFSTNDPSVTFSPTQVTTPGTAITVTYSGAVLAASISNTVTASVSIGGNAVLTQQIPVERSYLYVANANVTPGNAPVCCGNVAVYTFGSSGNAVPARVITGGSTNMYDPVVPRVDSLGNLYVLDNGSGGLNPVIDIYPPAANGNVTPRQISAISAVTGGVACEQMTLDPAQTHLWVTCDDTNLHVFTIPTLASTTAALAQTVSYRDGAWYFPEGLAFDNSGGLYVTDFQFNGIFWYQVSSLPTSGTDQPITSTHLMSGSQSWPATVQPLGVGVDNAGTLYGEIVYVSSTPGAQDSGNMIAQWGATTTPCTNCAPSGTLTGTPFTTHAPAGFTLDPAGNAYSSNPFNNTITEFGRATMVSGGTGTVNNPPTLHVLTTTASGAVAPTGLAIGP